MKIIVILSVVCFILFLGLVWCISSIHKLCESIQSILETMRAYDKVLGLEK